MLAITVFVVTFILLFFLFRYKNSSRRKIPPGPPTFPLIGSLPHFLFAGATKPSLAFCKLGAKYGNIFSLRIGSVPAVVINDYDALSEIAFHDALTNHLDENDVFLLSRTKGFTGIFNSRDSYWSETRSFCYKLLRKYGFGSKSIMEMLFMSEMKDFCDDLRSIISTNGSKIIIHRQFDVMFFNVTWNFLTGERFSKNDPRMKNMIELAEALIKAGKFGSGIATMYPHLMEYFPRLTGLKTFVQLCNHWSEAINEILNKYKRHGSYKSCPNNFIEEYLLAIDESKNPKNYKENPFSDVNLVSIIQDFSSAGIDTQSQSMKFLIRTFIQYPQVQNKVRTEIDQIIGRNRAPCVEDMANLIYTQATFWEILRLEALVPIMARKLSSNLKFRGFELNEGTLILANLYAMNIQESNWKDPMIFQPERFISPNGQLHNTDKVMTFGFGKRKCIGEVLAKCNLLLAMVTIVQQFIFEADADEGIPGEEKIVHGFTRDIKPFTVIVRSRD